MKIKKISITGMHKISQKEYTINDGITYFIGENGAGKSTILEAIELALLGYIPGYAKTNESIMKHASGPVMAIVAELDSGIKITRTWTKTGSTCSSNLDVQGYDGELSNLISKIELPIFNFDEFRSMTANKLKEWFIAFLPSSDDGFDITDELKKEAQKRSIPYEDVLLAAKEWISSRSEKGVDLIKVLNSHFKEDQSFIKGQISKLQGTLESLVRYEDALDIDENAIKEKIAIMQTQESLLTAWESKMQLKAQYDEVYNKRKAEVEQYKKALPAESFDKDPRVIEINDKIKDLEKQCKILEQDRSDINSALLELTMKRAAIPDAKPVCPYTNAKCETASSLSNKFKADAEELDKQIAFKREEAAGCDSNKIASIQAQIRELQNQLISIETNYRNSALVLAQMQKLVENSNSMNIEERPVSLSHEEISNELRQLQNMLIKIEANKRYDELASTVTKDKFKLENELEILKDWIKLTDANGLQSVLMDKPFENLAKDMSSYLTSMFNCPIEAKFNLVSKANSFSFGLVRDGHYIEFDYLSSGERCLFTLALIMCILNRSGSEIRTIIVDDILDHLDSKNATYLFDALKNITDIQFILAGVKECSDSTICVSI